MDENNLLVKQASRKTSRFLQIATRTSPAHLRSHGADTLTPIAEFQNIRKI